VDTSTLAPAPAQIPAHVPADLVRQTPFVFGTMTDRDPYNEWVPQIHAGPAIFYAPNAYPGMGPAWVIRKAQDLREVYLDTTTFSSKDFSPYSKLIGDTWINTPVEIDPPEHAKYRAFVNPLFTPKAMEKLEVKIRQYAAEFIDDFKGKGECEFMHDFAFEFPIKVFLELMGLPLELTPQFLEWETGLLHKPDLADIAKAARASIDYLQGEIDQRRKTPGDDAISYALGVEIDGRKLTNDELLGFTFNLFIGGLDTVSTNMGAQFLHLSQNVADQNYLRQNPDRIPDAIEEMMRAYAPVTTFRTVTRETEFKGVKMMPGDKVAMMTTLAARDPEEYEDPNAVKFDRKKKHLSFGFGPHLCVGIHLARREMRIAIEEFLARVPEFTLKPSHKIRRHLGMIQPVELPLVWKA
jgi:cytochrome P450